LPKELPNDENAETYITVTVGDDVNACAERIESIEMRVLISDQAAEVLPVSERIHGEPVRICYWSNTGSKCPSTKISRDFAEPPEKSILDNFRARINGVMLERPVVQEGWLVYGLKPLQLTLGKNLAGFKLKGRDPDSREYMCIEKLEIHLKYIKNYTF